MSNEPAQLLCARCGEPRQVHQDDMSVGQAGQLEPVLTVNHRFAEPPEVAVDEDQLIKDLDEEGTLGA